MAECGVDVEGVEGVEDVGSVGCGDVWSVS